MNLIRVKSFNLFVMYLSFTLLVSSGCLPQQSRTYNPNLNTNLQNDSDTEKIDTPPTSVLLNKTVNFFQVGTQQETSTLSIFADFDDSILLRGNQLNDFLRQLPNPLDRRFCLLTQYTQLEGSNPKDVFVMSARVKSFLNFSSNTNEFYLQLSPNNDAQNTTDCATSEVITLASSKFSSANFAFKVNDICPECTDNITSKEIFILSPSAIEQRDIRIEHLRLGILPSVDDDFERVSCSSSNNCESLGFNCCIDGQCVNHGEVIPGVNQGSDDFLIASQIIEARPELIINYGHLFFVCPTMVDTNPSNDSIDPNLDPTQEVANRFETLEELHNCINPVFDEYSVCTKTYEDASEDINNGGALFFAEIDDLTFKSINSNINFNNIKEVTYGKVILFKEGFLSTDKTVPLDPADGSFQSGSNDNLNTNQGIQINKALPLTAVNDDIKVRYTIDGSCEKLGVTLARCSKSYVQGQSSGIFARPSDHPSGKDFALPSYADLNLNLQVEVDGVQIARDSSTWSISGQGIEFADSFSIFNNSTIKITYFVTNNVDTLLKSKSEAQSTVNTICRCDSSSPCNLAPVTDEINDEEVILDYRCVYPERNIFEEPLRETIFISSKTAAHRYFDVNGVTYKQSELLVAPPQEGEPFLYEGNNDFKPNNVDKYIGFNEIYGTFNLSSTSALPATEIDVVKGRRYDLWAESGSFASCLNCGSDYYSSLVKVFPTEFQHFGSGYQPSLSESRRILNQSKFPADDMLFGRACFVPATMIPWTHSPNDDVNLQRQNRLAAQHFLFANGYNKDWYGFDYGSLIGSFDGVHWFSVGNARRVQATSNKLYLAVNGYYGDLTTNNSYQVTIQETVAVLFNGFVFDPDKDSILFHDPDTVISTDVHSFGAQCQRFHLCESDNDCLTRLGYDYVCAPVGGIKSKWPIFDAFGREQSGEKEVSLLALSGGSNGFPKRCVYRGKGAPCERNSHTLNSASDSYSNSTDVEVNVCSPNNYCEDINEQQFNTKIARFAGSPKNQNLKDFITDKSDTFGLSARILGRPFKYIGDEAVPDVVQTQLQATNISSICIPGKDPTGVNRTEDLNISANSRGVDNILNIGKTFSTNSDPDYLAACPAIDNEENSGNPYTYLLDVDISNDIHRNKTIAQNISSNRMKFFEDTLGLEIFNDDEESGLVTRRGFAKDSCMRAPGASCFTDLDCAPNHLITSKINTITDEFLNEAERNFWKEGLVCANAQNRKIDNSTFETPEYDLRLHKCCRELGKDFTFYSQKHQGDIINYIDNNLNLRVPGINSSVSDAANYSRVHTIFDKVSSAPNEFPAPLVPANSASKLSSNNFKLRQYNTINLHNSRMCCTGHWVRKFASGENANGGGSKFAPNKQQNFNNKEIFNKLNWNPAVDGSESALEGTDRPFVCNGNDASTIFCEMINIPEDSERDLAILKWFAKFELLGIPQVLIENSNLFYQPLDDQQEQPNNKEPFPGFFANEDANNKSFDVNFNNPSTLGSARLNPEFGSISGIAEPNNVEMYSAGNVEHFDLGSTTEQGLKQVFSPNEFKCCIPTGIQVNDPSIDSSDCCTGLLSDFGGTRRCCLEDFTDVTVYTNRYVSSEGAKLQGLDVPESDIDPVTGYLEKEVVLEMASTMCCSGQAAFGVAISDELFIPLLTQDGGNNGSDPNFVRRRWIFNNVLDTKDGVLATFEEGQRWNHHVYCVPGGSSGSGDGAGGAGVSQ